MGGAGAISSSANVATERFAAMIGDGLAGAWPKAAAR
jgi:dihydrodipicolinate synthase/N-acetylneuraminate lyase